MLAEWRFAILADSCFLHVPRDSQVYGTASVLGHRYLCHALEELVFPEYLLVVAQIDGHRGILHTTAPTSGECPETFRMGALQPSTTLLSRLFEIDVEKLGKSHV